jgi:S-adenosyl-L-methionine hydrolase (adenosine-forming)
VTILTFTTDFGEADGYVAAMKGVAVSLKARYADISHGIEPGDLLGAALVLEDARPWFPKGTVHVVVVDPGVGTDRRALVVRSCGQWFVGPDNGVLWPAIFADPRSEVRSIPIPAGASPTFHGRDVFTPAAAAIASGKKVGGKRITEPVRLPGFFCERHGGRIEGQVLRVDRFGNLVTNVRQADLDLEFDGIPFETLDIRLGSGPIDETARTYGLARPGVPFALIGSGGRVEIAVRDGSAAKMLGLGRGAPISMERRGGRR